VPGRILAGRALAKSGRAKSLAAILAAWRKEPFYGVRREWADAVSRSGTESAIGTLVALVEEEKDPMALERTIHAAGAHRDERLRRAIEKRLARGLPYRAAAAAYEALGAQRDDAPLDRIRKGTRARSFGGHVESGAFRGLAATRQRDAVAPLAQACAYGATPPRVRPSCVASLGEIGRHLERPERVRVRERLADLLRDPAPQVRRAAVGALDALGDPGAIGALERYRASVSEQEAAGVARVIRSLRDEDSPRGTALEKRVEALEVKLRKMGAAVERVEARMKKGERRPQRKRK